MFHYRAAQKFSLSSKKRKKKDALEPEPPPPYPTNFRDVILNCPPPVPPGLYRNMSKIQAPASSKVSACVLDLDLQKCRLLAIETSRLLVISLSLIWLLVLYRFVNFDSAHL